MCSSSGVVMRQMQPPKRCPAAKGVKENPSPAPAPSRNGIPILRLRVKNVKSGDCLQQMQALAQALQHGCQCDVAIVLPSIVNVC